MATLPPEPSSFSARKSHHARWVAESFGADPERYDRTRPRYPSVMVERLVAASPGRDVLDVGIGTGVSARPFRAASCRILGVEVDARMAEFAGSEGFDVEVATFEDWDPAGRTFDAVIAGQTWHWVDPVAGAAKAADVLRPGGRLAVFWNAFQLPPDLANAISAVYSRVLPDAPFPATSGGAACYAPLFTDAADGIRTADRFDEPEQWQFDWPQSYTRDAWLDVVPTFGGHTLLPPGRLDELMAGIEAAIDTVGGSFTVEYETVAVTATLADVA